MKLLKKVFLSLKLRWVVGRRQWSLGGLDPYLICLPKLYDLVRLIKPGQAKPPFQVRQNGKTSGSTLRNSIENINYRTSGRIWRWNVISKQRTSSLIDRIGLKPRRPNRLCK